MVLAFATNLPASAFNPSISINPYSLNTPTTTISSTHSLSYLTYLSAPYAMVMPLSIRFLFFSPPFRFSPSFSFFLIPTEWNPLRRGGGCNRLTICYFFIRPVPHLFLAFSFPTRSSILSLSSLSALSRVLVVRFSRWLRARRPSLFPSSLLDRINCSRSFTSHRRVRRPTRQRELVDGSLTDALVARSLPPRRGRGAWIPSFERQRRRRRLRVRTWR